jgi:hypothetical protein
MLHVNTTKKKSEIKTNLYVSSKQGNNYHYAYVFIGLASITFSDSKLGDLARGGDAPHAGL